MDHRTFYADARKRLVDTTDDPAVLEAFERLTERAAEGDDDRTDAALGVFLAEAARCSLSLDFIFCGAGEPFMRWQDA